VAIFSKDISNYFGEMGILDSWTGRVLLMEFVKTIIAMGNAYEVQNCSWQMKKLNFP